MQEKENQVIYQEIENENTIELPVKVSSINDGDVAEFMLDLPENEARTTNLTPSQADDNNRI